MTKSMRDLVGKAMYEAQCLAERLDWANEPEFVKEQWRAPAQTAITAYQSHLSDLGYVIVPRESLQGARTDILQLRNDLAISRLDAALRGGECELHKGDEESDCQSRCRSYPRRSGDGERCWGDSECPVNGDASICPLWDVCDAHPPLSALPDKEARKANEPCATCPWTIKGCSAGACRHEIQRAEQ
jgi:hypothetical protein